jgi:hypothetical protein
MFMSLLQFLLFLPETFPFEVNSVLPKEVTVPSTWQNFIATTWHSTSNDEQASTADQTKLGT